MTQKPEKKLRLQSLEELGKKLRYEPLTGKCWWTAPPRKGVGVVREAGYTNRLGYRQVRFGGHLYHCHKLAFYFTEGIYPDEVDHIDGDPSNNRLTNLQVISHKENMWKAKVRKDNKVGAKGVCFSKGKFIAYITRHGQTKYLGSFSNVEDAIKARGDHEKDTSNKEKQDG